MSSPAIDVLALGNALVDILSHEQDDLVTRLALEKGTMHMIDAARADEVYAAMGPATEVSGGSAANMTAGVASFGGRAAFIGRVADDTFGRVFAHDLRSAGVQFDSSLASDGQPTGRCLVIVTPDAQRTMSTFLGAATELEPDEVDEALVADSAVTYLEGYLWDQPPAKEAIRRAAAAAHGAGRRVALSLSDPFCVERHRDEFRALVEGAVDIVFANEDEICSLYRVDEFDDAVRLVRGHCEIAALTRGSRGSVVVRGNEMHVVVAAPVHEVVDTTGAGDLYAAGFLFSLTHGHDLATAGRLGSLAAAEVISHLGARPEVPLAELAAPLLG
ncbi:MAG: sugar kinase, ribokinase [Actinomycetia bacterium]|nr:sugar kinase, ribokinase [Actinomycetes bacterium]